MQPIGRRIEQTELASRYAAVRGATESLARRLSAEDCAVQSMPDASPVKWHLARTTWFFETFVLEPHPVTHGEFIGDGGYRRPELWLSAGWDALRGRGWQAPEYWERQGGGWHTFTPHGMVPVDPGTPVCHVSFYEAEAFARWANARLPTEAEWVESGALHPLALREARWQFSGLRLARDAG